MKKEAINRRWFIRLLLSGAISSNLLYSYFKYISPIDKNTSDENGHVVVFRCQSKSKKSSYSDEEAFWSDHSDPIVRALNNEFLKRGWLKKMNSTMIDRQTVEVRKVYASKQHAELFSKLWKIASPEMQKAEEGKVNYV